MAVLVPFLVGNTIPTHARSGPGARSRAAGGQLVIQPAADHLLLGKQEKLKIHVSIPKGAEDIHLTTSVGKIDGVRKVAAGKVEATYWPPEQFFPQIAIISATARNGTARLVGWTALSLWGKGQALVKTRSGAKVSVRIGERPFGPVKADRHGVARVPVIVPPGIRFGWDGARRVDLNLPPMKHLHLFASPPRVSGAVASAMRLFVIAVDDSGSPRSKPAPRVMAFGQAARLVLAGPGVWRAVVTVPEGKPTTLEASASFPGSAGQTARTTVERTAGAAVKIRVKVPAVSVFDPVTVHVRVTDMLGTLVDTRLSGTSDLGILKPFVRSARGTYQALYMPPAGRQSASHATLVISADGLSRKVRVRLPRPPAGRLHPAFFWTGVALTGAFIVAGIVTQITLVDKSSEYKDPATTIERRLELKDEGESLIAASGASFGLGAVMAIVSGVLYYYTKFKERPSKVSTSIRGGSFLVRTRF